MDLQPQVLRRCTTQWTMTDNPGHTHHCTEDISGHQSPCVCACGASIGPLTVPGVLSSISGADDERDALATLQFRGLAALEAALEVAQAEILSLRQRLWDVYGILGGDQDGDPTPAAVVNLGETVTDAARELRASYDECPAPEDLNEALAVAEVAQVENARLRADLDAGANAHGAPRPGVDVWRFCAAAEVENGRLRAACERAAKMNCAKGPRGKHYRDPVYCNDCVSCDARAALARSVSKDVPQ